MLEAGSESICQRRRRLYVDGQVSFLDISQIHTKYEQDNEPMMAIETWLDDILKGARILVPLGLVTQRSCNKRTDEIPERRHTWGNLLSFHVNRADRGAVNWDRDHPGS